MGVCPSDIVCHSPGPLTLCVSGCKSYAPAWSEPACQFGRRSITQQLLFSLVAILKMQDDLTQTSLTLSGVWFAGEYGDLLLHACPALPPEEGVEGEEGVDGSAAEWVQPVVKDGKEYKAGRDGGGAEKISSKVVPGGMGSGGVGAAYSAVEAGDVVKLMAKIMKVWALGRKREGG